METITDRFFRLNLVTSTKYRIYRHLAVLLIIAFAFYMSNMSNGDSIYAEPVFMYFKLTFCLFAIAICYFNMYFVIPRFLFRGSPVKYLISFFGVIILELIGILIIREVMKSIDQSQHSKLIIIPPIVQYLFMLTIFLAGSTAVKLFQRWIRDTALINELTRTGMQSELEQLKSQINPHFLLNMLNNANVLIQKDPVKASQVIIKLSDLLRYQLYDSARPKVLLTSDIQFLSDSLELEKIRRDNFEYTVSKEGQISGILIPPFLFITFVENAIKHSLSAQQPSFVTVTFEVQQNQIFFTCTNSKHKPDSKVKIGGLGLKNVKRRLELLFPENHILEIVDDVNEYIVKLHINL